MTVELSRKFRMKFSQIARPVAIGLAVRAHDVDLVPDAAPPPSARGLGRLRPLQLGEAAPGGALRLRFGAIPAGQVVPVAGRRCRSRAAASGGGEARGDSSAIYASRTSRPRADLRPFERLMRRLASRSRIVIGGRLCHNAALPPPGDQGLPWRRRSAQSARSLSSNISRPSRGRLRRGRCGRNRRAKCPRSRPSRAPRSASR